MERERGKRETGERVGREREREGGGGVGGGGERCITWCVPQRVR